MGAVALNLTQTKDALDTWRRAGNVMTRKLLQKIMNQHRVKILMPQQNRLHENARQRNPRQRNLLLLLRDPRELLPFIPGTSSQPLLPLIPGTSSQNFSRFLRTSSNWNTDTHQKGERNRVTGLVSASTARENTSPRLLTGVHRLRGLLSSPNTKCLAQVI